MNRLLLRIGRNLFPAVALTLILSASLWADDAATTYKAKCVACHGADGKGDTLAGKAVGAHDFASPEVQNMSDADLIGIVTMGKNKMPSYAKTLKPDDIKGLVAYVRSIAGKK